MNFFQFVVLTFVAGLFACSTCQSVNNQPTTLGLGEDCTVDADCTVTVANSYCNTADNLNKCACLPDYIQGNRTGDLEPTCFLKATELDKSDSCEILAQCKDLENTTCSARQCVCTEGFVSSGDKKECLNSNVLIGQPCKENQQCVGPSGSSECTLSKQCACKGEWVSNNNNTECLPIVNDLRNSECSESIQCHRGKPGNLSACVSESGLRKVCDCIASAVAIGTDNKCYSVATEVGNACEKDHQCEVGLGESKCINGACECNNPDFVSSTDRSKCLPRVELELPCIDNAQCTGNATCGLNASNPDDGQRCRCNTNYIGAENMCYVLASSIGGRCNDNPIQCIQLDATCNQTTKTCQCTADKVENSGKNKCLQRVASLNQPCEQTAQCQVSNSVCNLTSGQVGLRCQCRPTDYVESEIAVNTCVQIKHELNEKCDENRQCTAPEGLGELSECADGVCQCKRTYGYRNGTCYIPAELGQICRKHEECYVGVNELAFCSAPENRCRCLTGAIELDRKCYYPNLIGDVCASNAECTVSIQGEVQCDATTKSCKCRLGYTPDAGNRVCASGTMLQFEFSLSLCVLMLVMRLFSTT